MDDGGPTATYIIFFALLLIDVLFYGFGAAIRELNSKIYRNRQQMEQIKKLRDYMSLY